MLTKGTEIHGKRRQRLVGQKLTEKVRPRCWDCGSMLRKLDSRWALIQENETDLIFVDENEIIYPKRINVDKAGLVDFSIFRVFKLMLVFYWLRALVKSLFVQYENVKLKTFMMKLNICAVTQTQHFIELLALSCGQYAQVSLFTISYRGGRLFFTRQRYRIRPLKENF